METNEFLHCVDCGERDVRVLEFDQPISEESAQEVVCLFCGGGRVARRWEALRLLVGVER